eukprot:Nk52_evm15s2473 gene=Nk52_evmTU15s2473
MQLSSKVFVCAVLLLLLASSEAYLVRRMEEGYANDKGISHDEFNREKSALMEHLAFKTTTEVGELRHVLPRIPRKRRSRRAVSNNLVVPKEHTFANRFPSAGVQWVGTPDKGMNILFFALKPAAFSVVDESKLWISSDNGVTFKEINDLKDDAIQALIRLDADESRVVITAFDKTRKKSVIYTSKDSGASFQKSSYDGGLVSKIFPHPTDKDALVLIGDDRDLRLYYSLDFGKTWKATTEDVDKDVLTVDWATTGNSHTLFWISGSGSKRALHVTKDWFKTSYTIGEKCVGAKLAGDFLFAVTNNPDDPSSRYQLYSTKDESEFAMNRCVFSDGYGYDEAGFTIDDYSTKTIFATVDYSDVEVKGTESIRASLFVSDASATSFSMSLKSHFIYKPKVGSTVSDFARVSSFPGTYITNTKVLEGSNFNVKSLITYDNGGKWTELVAPEGSSKSTNCVGLKDGQECHLHLHSATSLMQNQIPSMMTAENAVGIVMATGNAGPYLGATPHFFVSADGGRSWKEGKEGIYSFAIGDHGALLVAVETAVVAKPEITKKAYYSFDYGDTWSSTELDKEIYVAGISTEPGSKTQVVSVFGYTKEHKWTVVVIDFSGVDQRACTEKDFEVFEPKNDEEKDCLLGSKYKFERRKKSASCTIGKDYSSKNTKEPCDCSDEDFECDFGYAQSGKNTCLRDEKVKLTRNGMCPSKNQKTYPKSNGYRKIAGDECKASAASKKYLSTESLKCTDLPTVGNPTMDERKDGGGGGGSSSSSSGGFGLGLAILVSVFAVGVVGAGVYIPYKYNMGIFGSKLFTKFSRNRGANDYSALSQHSTNALMNDDDFDQEETSDVELDREAFVDGGEDSGDDEPIFR